MSNKLIFVVDNIPEPLFEIVKQSGVKPDEMGNIMLKIDNLEEDLSNIRKPYDAKVALELLEMILPTLKYTVALYLLSKLKNCKNAQEVAELMKLSLKLHK